MEMFLLEELGVQLRGSGLAICPACPLQRATKTKGKTRPCSPLFAALFAALLSQVPGVSGQFAQIEFPVLPDKIVSKAVMRFFLDEPKSLVLVDMASGVQDIVGP